MCSIKPVTAAAGYIQPADPIPEWCPLEDVSDEFDEVLKEVPDDRKDVVRQLLENQAESLKKLQLKVEEPPSMSWTIGRLKKQLEEKDERISLLEDNLGEFDDVITALTKQNETITLESGFITDSVKKILATNKKLKELDTDPDESENPRKLDL